jgi:hypothetical protein
VPVAASRSIPAVRGIWGTPEIVRATTEQSTRRAIGEQRGAGVRRSWHDVDATPTLRPTIQVSSSSDSMAIGAMTRCLPPGGGVAVKKSSQRATHVQPGARFAMGEPHE